MEVKNWSGSIHLNQDGSWVQIRNNGSTVVHPNLVCACSSQPFVCRCTFCNASRHVNMICYYNIWMRFQYVYELCCEVNFGGGIPCSWKI